jgi:DNA repair exonuclease SbcCD ATPase subunit
MKWHVLGFCLAAFSATIHAQAADPCAGSVGVALGQCQDTQQKLQRQQLAQQQQQLALQQQQLAQQQQQLAQQQQQLMRQQQELQQQLQQQRDVQSQLNAQQPQDQKQLDGMQHQIESLTKQLEREKTANQPVQRQDFISWKADNPWYGSDYAKTRFAMRYIRQLQREQPDLAGRPFLDAVSAKVSDQFGSSR